MLDVARQQQLVDHGQHEESRHSVIREPLPRLGEGEIGEALRMTEKGAAGSLVERNCWRTAQMPAPLPNDAPPYRGWEGRHSPFRRRGRRAGFPPAPGPAAAARGSRAAPAGF